MGQMIEVHPRNPQPRLLQKMIQALKQGALIVYPTDTAYAFACLAGAKAPLDRLIRIRRLSNKHLFTLVCRDFSQASEYVRIENHHFRTLKACLPGPYTFILPATRLTPKRLLSSKRKTIGIRVPDHPVPSALLADLDVPLLTSTVILPEHDDPLVDPFDIFEQVGSQIDWLLDAGLGSFDVTTVVNLCDDVPEVIRHGIGDTSLF